MRTAVCTIVLLALGGLAMADVVELQDFDELWDYGDPTATEAKFRELLPAAAAKGAEYHAQLLTQIARTQGLRGEFAAAHAVLAEAQGLVTDDCVVAPIRIQLERGRAFNSAGKKEEAIREFEAALALAKKAKAEFHMVDAGHMLAIAEEPDKALEWSEKTIAMAEAAKSEKARGWLGPLYNNTGWTYHDKKDYKTALQYFLKSLAFRKERKQTKQMRIAKWTIARCLRSLGRHEEALANQRALLEEYEKENHRDGFVYEEIGENLWAMNNKRESRSWFRGAYELLCGVEWLKRSDPDRIQSLKERGQVEDPQKKRDPEGDKK